MAIPHFLSEHTLSLDPSSEAWLESALSDADEEARLIAAELMSPNDVGYEALVEKYYDELCDRLYASAI